MNLTIHYPPHIRSRDSSASIMFDIIVALMPLYGMAMYFYGFRAVALGLISALTCLIADYACTIMAGKGITLRDISPIVTGLIIALLLPATANVIMVVTAALFAMFVVKHPFGGLGQNVFNPAAGGVAFVTLCWPNEFFLYPPTFMSLPLASAEAAKFATERSVAYSLKLAAAPMTDFVDIALGNVPGPMGATNILIMLACLFYLIVRRGAKPAATFSFLASSALVAMIFPRGNMGIFQSLMFELMSGSLLFASIFLLSDPVTSPKRNISRIIYGASGGILCMLFRHIGRFEESVIFGILIMNAFVWVLDTRVERIYHFYRRKYLAENKSQEVSEVQG